MTSLFDIEKIRKDFPVLHQEVHGHPLAYLDNAATSQKPQSVIDAITRYYSQDNSNVHRGIHELSNRATDAYEAARTKVAQFIGAESDEEIIFTRNTTESLNLIANTWAKANLQKGDTIILTEMEHHSNIVPWQVLALEKDFRLEFLPIQTETGFLNLDELPNLLPQAKLISVVHVSNTTGTINNVKEICRMAKEYGVISVVDAAQSVGHRPVNVREIGCDFLAFSGHKMCGPTGIGVLYGKKELLEKMPPYQTGGSMVNTVTLNSTSYRPTPYRYEAGTPNIAGVIGLHAAINYLESIGLKQIQQYDHQLCQYAYQQISSIPGITIIGPKEERANVVSFEMKEAHSHDVVTLVDRDGIALRGGHHCSQPLLHSFNMKSTSRASFYFYNTLEEIDRLVESLKHVKEFFGDGS